MGIRVRGTQKLAITSVYASKVPAVLKLKILLGKLTL